MADRITPTHKSGQARIVASTKALPDLQLATHVSIGSTPEGFFLNFALVSLPSSWEEIEANPALEADIVARLFLPSQTMASLIDVLVANPEFGVVRSEEHE